MSDIVWEDPPAAPLNGRHDWTAILDEFRRRPGQWGQVAGDHAAGVAFAIKAGKLGGASLGEFDATCRGVQKNPPRFHVWVRYIGGES